MNKPYAASSDENKEPLLEVLREVLAGSRRVLEIGSGTGQHAAHFGLHLPHLVWLPSDLPENLPGIRLWLDEAGLPNVPAPLALDVNDAEWPVPAVDAVFSANTAHIMDWASVGALFAGVGRLLRAGSAGCCAREGCLPSTGRFTTAVSRPARATPASTHRCAPGARRWGCATSKTSTPWRVQPACGCCGTTRCRSTTAPWSGRRRAPEAQAQHFGPIAVRSAASETGLPEETFPAECPFTVDQALDQGYWPE